MGRHKHRDDSPRRTRNVATPPLSEGIPLNPLYQRILDSFVVNIRVLPEHPPVPTNVVYTAYLEHKQDLSKLPDAMPNVKRNSTHFSSCNIKILNPTGTVLLFESGKLVCVGAMTPAVGFCALMRMRLRLLETGSPCEFNNPSINNIVMVNDLGYAINMAKFVAENEECCHYVPEKFSGCTFSPSGGADTLELEFLADNELEEEELVLEDLDSVAPEKYIIPEGKKAQKKSVVFETRKFNCMGVQSYDEGFELSEATFKATAAYRCNPRTSRVKVVIQRQEELKKARIEYQKKTAEPTDAVIMMI